MLVTLDGVGVVRGSRPILQDVSLALSSGETVALVGPSGAGKSTLLGVVAGDLRPTRGTVRTVARESAAWIVQSTPVLARRSALDNVALGALSSGSTRRAAERTAIGVMTALGIETLAPQAVHRLSGGERQRVAVARAMAAESALILADEPTAALDAVSRSFVIDALTRAAQEGAAVVVATHDPVVAEACDRLLRIDAGLLVDPREARSG
ncbi:ATP-binding cassette domain-containing protein [Rathayibacter sp. VKM Ac-2754]|uniref:ATP-binding cassette domain-containing protein n=1 Tax=Rathayibacter sp. VKM Ac-2754 TaxID=2609251 RepID=UPI00135B309D|nr:ATP-binding cassette domain-containing protein [Rathayibacter sp. VKM Ac-2754]MWV59660.1 ATP-binding cassette domain-containing protein [Rathayibacter sp. VKM Ac-2754]